MGIVTVYSLLICPTQDGARYSKMTLLLSADAGVCQVKLYQGLAARSAQIGSDQLVDQDDVSCLLQIVNR